MATWSDLSWSRPLGLAAFVLPLLFLVFAARRGAPHWLAAGTVRLWRRFAEQSARRGRRPRIPWSAWLFALALGLGALAMAGPRRSAADGERRVEVIVDRSPSMYLVHSAGETRLAAGARRLAAWLAEQRVDRVLWRAGLEAYESRSLPAAFAQPLVGASEPDWLAFDRHGTVWLSDRPPTVEPEFAGLCLSGGPAVPGGIEQVGRVRLMWDGTSIVRAAARAAPTYRIVGGLPPVLSDVVAAWAAERGFESAPDANADLVIEAPAADGATAMRVGRDRWEARAQAVALAPDAGESIWLSGPGAEVLVTHAVGRVRCGLLELSELDADAASFAVSWARLFDRARRPPPGVVPWSERQAAEAHELRPPQVQTMSSPAAQPFDAPLAVLAAAGLWLSIVFFSNARTRRV